MTVKNQTQKVTGVGNGAATVFSISPLVIFASTNIQVYHVSSGGVETLLAEGVGASNYSVQVTYPGTGSITYPADQVTPMPSGEKVITKRLLTLEQQTDFENQEGYLPETLEQQLDKLVMIDIQQQEEIDRGIAFNISADLSNFDTEIPDPSGNTNRVLGVNSSGTGWTYVSSIADTLGVPGSSTDHALVRWDGTDGGTIQNSVITVDDSGNVAGIVNLTITDLTLTGSLKDSNGNEIITVASVASAVNEITVTNAATGNGPSIAATGTDTNIDMTLSAKGTGDLIFSSDVQMDRVKSNAGFDDRTVSSSSGTLALDFSGGNKLACTLTENITTITFTGAATGDTLTVRFKQAAASSYTVSGWPGATKWTDKQASAPTMPSANDAYLVITFDFDGTNYIGSAS